MSEKQQPHEAPSFSEFITDLDHGRIDQLLTDRLADVVRGVRETNKVGEMTIKLLVKMEGTMAIIAVDVKAKKPEHALHGTLFYVGANGELLREDPKQLPLRNLNTPPLRAVQFPTAGAVTPIEPEPAPRARPERIDRPAPPVDFGNERDEED